MASWEDRRSPKREERKRSSLFVNVLPEAPGQGRRQLRAPRSSTGTEGRGAVRPVQWSRAEARPRGTVGRALTWLSWQRAERSPS